MQVLRLIGVGAAGGGQERIAVTAAAAAGGRRPTLLHGVKTAALHMRRDVGRRRCERASDDKLHVISPLCPLGRWIPPEPALGAHRADPVARRFGVKGYWPTAHNMLVFTGEYR